jgi:hypothetical protein
MPGGRTLPVNRHVEFVATAGSAPMTPPGAHARASAAAFEDRVNPAHLKLSK